MYLPGLEDVELSRRTYVVSTEVEHCENEGEDYLFVLPSRPGRLRVERGTTVVHDGAVRPGMIRVVEPGERSQMSAQAPFGALMLRVPTASVEAVREQLGARTERAKRVAPLLPARPQVHSITTSLAYADAVDETVRPQYVQGLAFALLTVALRADGRAERSRSTPTGLDDEQWSRATHVALASLETGLDLGAWAGSLTMSVDQFSRRFRERAGRSPYAWFLDRRIERAQELLLARRSLVDVALMLGFTSQSHFTDAFRRRVGTSPGDWRARQAATDGGDQ